MFCGILDSSKTMTRDTYGVTKMFKFNRISVKRFESTKDVELFVKLYNNLSERSVHDHTEISNKELRMKEFENTGFDDDKNTNYMIFNENEQFIGTIGYKRESEFELTMGYRLLKHSYRSKGYMTEALKPFVKYIFETKNDINRLSLYIHSDNVGSKKVASKCGFTYEGTMRDAYKYRGKIVGFEIYSLLRKEYEMLVSIKGEQYAI